MRDAAAVPTSSLHAGRGGARALVAAALGAAALGATGACGGVAAAPDAPPEASDAPATRCPSIGAPVDGARVDDPRLTEILGLVASRTSSDTLWVHNDSGEAVARVFALGLDGAVRLEVVLDGAPHVDCEDIALEVRDGADWLYLGDIGDNGARDGSSPPRTSVDVMRFPAPSVPATPAADAVHLSTFEQITLTYPDGPRDAEALFVDPATGDLYLIDKVEGGPHGLYVARAPLVDGERRTLERVLDLLPSGGLADEVTGADIDATGRIAVRTYGRPLLFLPTDSGRVTDTLAGAPLRLPVLPERQGEALGFAADGARLWSISEGASERLHALPDRCAP